VNVKRFTLWFSLALAFSVRFIEPVAAQSPSRKGSVRDFSCSVGYTSSECSKQVAVLRAAVRKYPVGDLGDWNWVIVRSFDWKRFLSDRNLTPDIPAFTYLPKRETFFDEALLQTASARSFELAASWKMSIPELLDLAVRHELGHALCGERDEAAAKRTAQLLLDLPKLSAFQACRARRPRS
jgi:hypothetical protein